MITLTQEAFEDLLEQAAERGAKKALASVGLADDRAPDDVRSLRDLLQMYRFVRNGALTQIGKSVVLVLLGGLAVWIGMRLDWRPFK